MCFWHENILIGVLRGDRHVNHRKHLNQDCTRACKQHCKNRPFKEQYKIIKISEW